MIPQLPYPSPRTGGLVRHRAVDPQGARPRVESPGAWFPFAPSATAPFRRPSGSLQPRLSVLPQRLQRQPELLDAGTLGIVDDRGQRLRVLPQGVHPLIVFLAAGVGQAVAVPAAVVAPPGGRYSLATRRPHGRPSTTSGQVNHQRRPPKCGWVVCRSMR
jgi:hypothetical protein